MGQSGLVGIRAQDLLPSGTEKNGFRRENLVFPFDCVRAFLTCLEIQSLVAVRTKHQGRKKPEDRFSPKLVAPCGIDCRVCIAYLREKNPCSGCRRDQASKPKTRSQCKIKHCENLKKDSMRFCFECDVFPCARLRGMDLRYRTKYHISVIENLAAVKRDGIRIFVQQEVTRWRCPQCGNILCVHRDRCLSCGAVKITKE